MADEPEAEPVEPDEESEGEEGRKPFTRDDFMRDLRKFVPEDGPPEKSSKPEK